MTRPWSKGLVLIEPRPIWLSTKIPTFAHFHNGRRRDKHYIVAQNGAWLALSRTSALFSFLSKFNPQNIFSESDRPANKEAEVTCEMGLKSTHLI